MPLPSIPPHTEADEIRRQISPRGRERGGDRSMKGCTGVIADDLTGAAELGAVGRRYGLSAQVVSGGGLDEIRRGTDAELFCMNTDSRSCSPAEAVGRIAQAARIVQDAEVTAIYKKVDSVLRGHVAIELGALMRQLGRARCLLVPANPSLGRVIRDGTYFVGGEPIHQTDFRFDPEYPRTSSSVMELLGTHASLAIKVVRTNEALPSNGIIVGEAERASDLVEWANRIDEATLPAGGAEFFAAFMARAREDVTTGRSDITANPAELSGCKLFVCGSASESTRAFVEQSRQRGVPIFGLPEAAAGGADFSVEEQEQLTRRMRQALESNGRIVLAVGLPLIGDKARAARLALHLVEIARDLIGRAEIGQIFVEGGATAAALVRRMGWERLQVLRELAPGVVTLGPGTGQRPLLTLKPGSYAWPAEILQ